VVARVHEVPSGARKLVTLAGREIGVFNLGGEFFAIRNRCPHQGASLCAGRLVPVVHSRHPGDHRLGDTTLLQCPWHGWEFDVRDGQSWCDPGRLRVRSYKVEVEREARSGETQASVVEGRVMGPYRAESYPVTVEDGDVIVDLG
jgi:3-phenylpropionate/trans-cinnamate dioxygenase ferredoxin subunit